MYLKIRGIESSKRNNDSARKNDKNSGSKGTLNFSESSFLIAK